MEKDELKHLKSESYYSDLYDRFTVEEGRRYCGRGISEDHTLVKTTKPKSKKDLLVEIFSPTILYFFKGERYLNKAKTIQEWMDRDRRRDQKFENAQPPAGICCFYCGSTMDVFDKTLHTELDDSKDRILFFFECPKCHKRRAFWDNGEEWKIKPTLCSKCRAEMKSKDVR